MNRFTLWSVYIGIGFFVSKMFRTNEANRFFFLQLLYQDRNVGVHYEYSIPKKFSARTDPDSYTWVTDEFSSCSVSCGGGIIRSHDFNMHVIKTDLEMFSYYQETIHCICYAQYLQNLLIYIYNKNCVYFKEIILIAFK